MKGKRVAISAMMDENGFDNDSIDIFDYDTNHSMNSDHFAQWIEGAAFGLRKKFGAKSSNPHCYRQCYRAQRAY